MIKAGHCFIYIKDGFLYDWIPFYNLETSYKLGDLVVFENKIYQYVRTNDIKDSGNYKEIAPGFYEPIMEKFRKVEDDNKMKELKAGQWVKCIKSYVFVGGGSDDNPNFKEIIKDKYYKVHESKIVPNLGCPFINLIVLDKCGRNRSLTHFKNYFDLDNPLDYNPDDVKLWDGALTHKKGDIFRISSMEDIGIEDGIYKIEDIIYSEDTKYNEHEITWKRLGVFKEEDMQKEDKPKFKVGDKVKIIGNKQKNGDVGKIGYIKCVTPLETYKVFTDTNWYVDAKDLELVVEEHEEITPENIAEVLEYNGITDCKIKNFTDTLYIITPKYAFGFNDPHWLQHLELEVGKLKPLPKKPEPKKKPTLEDALIDLGFKHNNGCYYTKNNIMVTSWNELGLMGIKIIGSQFVNDFFPSEFIYFPYITKEQLAKDIAAFEERHKEPTFEEALIELGFQYDCPFYKKNSISISLWGKNIFSIFNKKYTRMLNYTTKEQLIKDIAEFEKKNRPHWSLVDDGGHGKEIGKIYRDEIKEKVNSGILVIGAVLHILFMNYEHSQPYQYINKESDFGILCKDGSLIKAIWSEE